MWILQAQFAGHVLAQREVPGIELVPWRPGSDAIDVVQSGRAEFAVVSPSQLLAAGERAYGLVFVALFMRKSPIVLAGLRSGPGESLAAAEGERVGTWENEDVEVRAMLVANGVDLRRVEFVPMGADVAPLLDGQVTFLQATTYEEVPALLTAGADPHDLILHRPSTWGVDVAKDGLVVRHDVLAHESSLVDAVLGAVTRGWHDALVDPHNAVRAVCDLDPSLDPNWQLNQLNEISQLFEAGVPTGWPDPAEFERAARVHRLIGNPVDVSLIHIDEGPWKRATDD